MPGHQDAWRSEGDVRGSVRFVVLRREEGDNRTPALVGSGTEPDVRTAMTKKGAHGGPARLTATRGRTITECGEGVMMLPRPTRHDRSGA
jgi:hypothetical protein